MPSVRRQVLDYAVTRVTGLPVTGARVWLALDHPHSLNAGEVPGLKLFDLGDVAVEPVHSSGLGPERRRGRLRIRVLVATEVSLTLDAIEVEIEKALGSSPQVAFAGGLLQQRLHKLGSELSDPAEGEYAAAALNIDYEYGYAVMAGVPDEALTRP